MLSKLEMARKALRSIEWSGEYLDGTGCRMGYAAIDGIRYEACPFCGGINPKLYKNAPDDIRKGHSRNCLIRRALED